MRRESVPELDQQVNRIVGTRIASTLAAIDAAQFPSGALVLRLAPDEVFVAAAVSADAIADPHAIVEPDAGFVGAWVNADEALAILTRHCEWEPPQQRPAFAQGAVGGLATKLWFEADRVLFAVPAPYASELALLLSDS
jgi:hypothetical protein